MSCPNLPSAAVQLEAQQLQLPTNRLQSKSKLQRRKSLCKSLRTLQLRQRKSLRKLQLQLRSLVRALVPPGQSRLKSSSPMHLQSSPPQLQFSDLLLRLQVLETENAFLRTQVEVTQVQVQKLCSALPLPPKLTMTSNPSIPPSLSIATVNPAPLPSPPAPPLSSTDTPRSPAVLTISQPVHSVPPMPQVIVRTPVLPTALPVPVRTLVPQIFPVPVPVLTLKKSIQPVPVHTSAPTQLAATVHHVQSDLAASHIPVPLSSLVPPQSISPTVYRNSIPTLPVQDRLAAPHQHSWSPPTPSLPVTSLIVRLPLSFSAQSTKTFAIRTAVHAITNHSILDANIIEKNLFEIFLPVDVCSTVQDLLQSAGVLQQPRPPMTAKDIPRRVFTYNRSNNYRMRAANLQGFPPDLQSQLLDHAQSIMHRCPPNRQGLILRGLQRDRRDVALLLPSNNISPALDPLI